MNLTQTKTLTRVTLPTGRAFNLIQHRNGWPIPTDDGAGKGWISGTGAHREALERWKQAGATVERIPNPNYRPRVCGFRL